MSASVSTLPDGNLSLELGEEDLERLSEIIDETYGPPGVEQGVTLTSYTIAGAEFLFANEWGDPCLRSRDAAGHAILLDLAQRLGWGGAP